MLTGLGDLLRYTHATAIVGDILKIRARDIGLGDMAIVEIGDGEQSLAQDRRHRLSPPGQTGHYRPRRWRDDGHIPRQERVPESREWPASGPVREGPGRHQRAVRSAPRAPAGCPGPPGPVPGRGGWVR